MTADHTPVPAIRPFRQIGNWGLWWIRLWEQPVFSAVMAIIVYTAFAVAHSPVRSATNLAYFNYLADAFLHGQLHLRLPPPNTRDLSFFHGKYYLYWGPFPAVVLMPFVAIFGLRFSDIIFTLVAGALNVALVALLLRQACRRYVLRLSQLQRGLLVVVFALGTVHITLAPYARVWFTGELVGFFFVACAYLVTVSLSNGKAFALTGLALAAALLTRNHLVLNGLWPACYLLHRHRAVGRRHLLIYIGAGLIPIVLAVSLLGAYDQLRFGSLFDNGLAYHDMAPEFTKDYPRYGAFNLHYVPTNLFYQYIAYPLPIRDSSYQGGSLFLLTPVFWAIFVSIVRGYRSWSVWALSGTIILVACPILLLMGTGWVQWGPRYTLDFMVPLLLLTALGIRRWPIWLLTLLTSVSLAHYLYGAFRLIRYL